MEVAVKPAEATYPGMYRIQFIKPGGRITMESQMFLFAMHHSDHEGEILLFSARPVFGTQDMRASMITSMIRVDDDAEVYVNWDPRKTNQKPISWRHVRLWNW